MFGIGTIMVVIMAVLMYLSNNYQQSQILASYCGDFGFYSKSLTLMKDKTFKFNYYGCSQLNGRVSGKWTADGEIITLIAAQYDSYLDSSYRQANDRLLPLNKADEEGFIFCNDYKEPWLLITVE